MGQILEEEKELAPYTCRGRVPGCIKGKHRKSKRVSAGAIE